MQAYVKRFEDWSRSDEPPTSSTLIVTKTPPYPGNWKPDMEFVICDVRPQFAHLAQQIADALNAQSTVPPNDDGSRFGMFSKGES